MFGSSLWVYWISWIILLSFHTQQMKPISNQTKLLLVEVISHCLYRNCLHLPLDLPNGIKNKQKTPLMDYENPTTYQKKYEQIISTPLFEVGRYKREQNHKWDDSAGYPRLITSCQSKSFSWFIYNFRNKFFSGLLNS